jgi:hypothetical protein
MQGCVSQKPRLSGNPAGKGILHKGVAGVLNEFKIKPWTSVACFIQRFFAPEYEKLKLPSKRKEIALILNKCAKCFPIHWLKMFILHK